MRKRTQEIVPAIIKAWRDKYHDDTSKLTRAALQAAKPGHGTATYRTALAELKLKLCGDKKEIHQEDLVAALDNVINIAQSIKDLIKSLQLTEDIAALKQENADLKKALSTLLANQEKRPAGGKA